MNVSNQFFFIAIALLIGTLMPVQAGLNANLSKFLKHPLHSAFISFFIGTVTLGLALLPLKVPFSLANLKTVPLSYFAGGILGSLFVFSSLFLIHKIGATALITSFIIGQLFMSLFLDHFALLGVPQIPINLSRICGMAFLFLGLVLITRK